MSAAPAPPGRRRSRPGRSSERARELREQLEHHSHRYYVLDDPEIGDDRYDLLLDELRGIEAQFPQLATPDSPTQRVGGEPVGRLEKVRHLEPMLSLANARSEEELRAWVERMRNHLAREGIEQQEFQLRGRAQDRRPGDQPAVPRRRARAGRHPRQRRDRRGRHPQPAHDRGGPAARPRRPQPAGGAGRGVHVAEGLHGAQRAPRRSRRVDLHEPPQLGRRDDPPARPPRCRQASPVDLVLPGGGHRGPAASSATHRRCSGSPSTASASTPASARSPPRSR